MDEKCITEKTNEPKNFRLDWLISDRLGEFGKYQKRIFILLGFPSVICAMHALSWVFLGANVKHRCQLDGEHISNASYETLPHNHVFNESFPMSSDGTWSQCEKFEKLFIDTDLSTDKMITTVPCDGEYVYDKSQYKSSARIDYQLICENTVWYTVAETLFKSGILVGALVFGNLSDRFGRRPGFFFALCQQAIFGVVAAVAPNYTIFVMARFMVGMATSGVFLVAFVIVMEIVGKQKRILATMGMQLFFAAGYVFVGILAFFIREWRYLQLTIALPGIIFLSYYLCLPESILWLLAKGRKEEAVKILQKIGRINCAELTETELSQLSEKSGETDEKSIQFREILKYKRTMLRSLNVFFCWFVNSGVYYGLALNAGNLGGNDYVNFILSGAVEFPSCGLLLFANFYGRKRALCGCMLSAGIFLIACGFISEEHIWLLVTLNMIGKLFNAAAYAIIYMYSAELFPTVIRNSFMGISSMMAETGGIASDYVLLMQEVWKPLPHLIFGSVSLISGFLTLFLPETLGKRLPESMEDAENF